MIAEMTEYQRYSIFKHPRCRLRAPLQIARNLTAYLPRPAVQVASRQPLGTGRERRHVSWNHCGAREAHHINYRVKETGYLKSRQDGRRSNRGKLAGSRYHQGSVGAKESFSLAPVMRAARNAAKNPLARASIRSRNPIARELRTVW